MHAALRAAGAAAGHCETVVAPQAAIAAAERRRTRRGRAKPARGRLRAMAAQCAHSCDRRAQGKAQGETEGGRQQRRGQRVRRSGGEGEEGRGAETRRGGEESARLRAGGCSTVIQDGGFFRLG